MKINIVQHITPLLFAVACASSSSQIGRTEARGDLYAQRQSPELARAEYIRALEDDPDNERLRDKLIATNQALLTLREQEIEDAIMDGEPIAAAYTLSKARQEFGEDHEHLVALDARVTSALQSALRQAEKQERFDLATKLHAALLAYVPETSRANRVEQKRYRDAWSTQLRARALDDESQRLHASASLHWAKIHELSRDDAHLQRAIAQRALATAPHVYSVSLLHHEQAELDQRLVLPHLANVLPHPDIELLADGSAAQGATFTIMLRDLRCDERQEMHAANKVASKRPVIVQRCMTTFATNLIPTDAYREELSAEKVLTQEFYHKTGVTLDDAERARVEAKLADELHGQGAQLISDLLAQDFRRARDRILERAYALPLERAVMDAKIILYWLEPTHYGTAQHLDEIEKISGFEHVGELLRSTSGEG